jgi:raffinose/stachyose/melibiose transport system substrate-binding protein
MSYKPLRTVLLVLVFLLVCGSLLTASPTQEKVTLRVMNFSPGAEDNYKNIADIFTKKYPNLSFTFEAKPFDQYFVLMDTQIQAGEAPDLFAALGTASTVLAKWARAGSIQQLDGIFDVSGFLPWLVKDFMVDGKLYQSPPLVGDLYGVLYNKDVFDKYGLKPPKTQADFAKICDTFVASGITPIFLAGKNITQDQLINIAAAYAPTWNNDFPWHKRHYSDPEFVNMLRLMQSWVDKGYFGKDFKSLDDTAALTLYSQGKIAMSLGASYTQKGLQAAAPSTSLFFLPTPDGKGACIQTPAQSYGWCLNSASKHKTEAITLMKFLATAEAMQGIVDEFGSVPLSQSASKGLTVSDPVTKLFASGDNPVPCFLDQISPIAAKGYDVWSIVMTNTSKLFYKQATPEQIAAEFDQMTDWSLVK